MYQDSKDLGEGSTEYKNFKKEFDTYAGQSDKIPVEETYEYFHEHDRKFLLEAHKNSSEGTSVKQREEPYMPVKNMSNVIFCWGCQPEKGVLADTRMIHDFFDTMKARYDKKTLCLIFPKILDNMLGDKGDCNWEFWNSNQI